MIGTFVEQNAQYFAPDMLPTTTTATAIAAVRDVLLT